MLNTRVCYLYVVGSDFNCTVCIYLPSWHLQRYISFKSVLSIPISEANEQLIQSLSVHNQDLFSRLVNSDLC